MKNVDVFSKKATYHASCRIQNLSAWRSSNPLTRKKMEEEHRATFTSVHKVIDMDIALDQTIVQLSFLTKI